MGDWGLLFYDDDDDQKEKKTGRDLLFKIADNFMFFLSYSLHTDGPLLSTPLSILVIIIVVGIYPLPSSLSVFKVETLAKNE